MKTQMNAYRLKRLIVLHATGTIDLAASKAALAQLVAGPGFEARNEVVPDLRDSECEMSAADVFALAEFMSDPHATPRPPKNIALLIDEYPHSHAVFNRAHFRDMRAGSKCLNMRTFADYDHAKVRLSPH